MGQTLERVPAECTYSLGDAEHGIRHVESLLSVMESAIVEKDGTSRPMQGLAFPYEQYLVWLLDSVLALQTEKAGYTRLQDQDCARMLRIGLRLTKCYNTSDHVDTFISQKTYTVLILLCRQYFADPKDVLADDERGRELRDLLCAAMILIAKGTLDYRPVSALVSTHLLISAHATEPDHAQVGQGTDIWVGRRRAVVDTAMFRELLMLVQRSLRLLQQVAASPPPEFVDEDVAAANFASKALRDDVAKLRLASQGSGETDTGEHCRRPKRLKLSPGPTLEKDLIRRILRTAGLDQTENQEACLADELPYVFHV